MEPYFGNPNPIRLKHVLKKLSNERYFLKFLWEMIRHVDLEQNAEETECIKQSKSAYN